MVDTTFFEKIFGVPEGERLTYLDLGKFFPSEKVEPFNVIGDIDPVGSYFNDPFKALNFVQNFISVIDNEISALKIVFEDIADNKPIKIANEQHYANLNGDYFDAVETVLENGSVTCKEWFRLVVKIYLGLDQEYWMVRAGKLLTSQLLYQMTIAHADEVMKVGNTLTRCEQLIPDLTQESFLQFFFENGLTHLLRKIDEDGYVDVVEIESLNLPISVYKKVISKLEVTHPYVKGERRIWLMLPQSRYPVINILDSIEKGLRNAKIPE